MSGGGSSGRGSGPNTGRLLLVFMGVVPLVVLVAVLAAYFLVRAGVGVVVGAGVPFVVGTVFVVGLGVALGRAASGSGEPPDEGSGDSGGRSRKRDGKGDGV